jgi:hypothetical protein
VARRAGRSLLADAKAARHLLPAVRDTLCACGQPLAAGTDGTTCKVESVKRLKKNKARDVPGGCRNAIVYTCGACGKRRLLPGAPPRPPKGPPKGPPRGRAKEEAKAKAAPPAEVKGGWKGKGGGGDRAAGGKRKGDFAHSKAESFIALPRAASPLESSRKKKKKANEKKSGLMNFLSSLNS